ncbi:immunity 22 family protein [Paenibacillus methanolicus]|uniref:Immunity protein 22 of polymorphic toxin system n=1 Tax=Paenibacillus methanolicus TaxID=582686 RepID=A0A5S5CHN1_9BACL|nr:immunity 22 family protein [Paenibacillus methanolicus]TYP78118.1 immunity protein 22 of polymorphic toxin system [Paenibacillus methanolicus]
MEKRGYASLWTGRVQSQAQLEELLHIAYTEDGDSLPSPFAAYFAIEDYDDDFREAEFREEGCRNLDELLDGFSYADVLLPRFRDRFQGRSFADVNAVILLYDFDYAGTIREAVGTQDVLRFEGSVSYADDGSRF